MAGNRKGAKATDRQKEAGKANLKKAHESKRVKGAARKAARKAGEKPRWKQLEDGDISVRDLTLEELARCQVANNDGTWDGRRHEFTPRMQRKMTNELGRKYRADFDRLSPKALEAMEAILDDDEAKAQQVPLIKMITEYRMGKVPDVVHVGPETEFDKLQQAAFTIARDMGSVSGDDD